MKRLIVAVFLPLMLFLTASVAAPQAQAGTSAPCSQYGIAGNILPGEMYVVATHGVNGRPSDFWKGGASSLARQIVDKSSGRIGLAIDLSGGRSFAGISSNRNAIVGALNCAFQANHSRPVVVVGYSNGGLQLLDAICSDRKTRPCFSSVLVKAYIAIGVPFSGAYNRPFGSSYCCIGADLKPGSYALAMLPSHLPYFPLTETIAGQVSTRQYTTDGRYIQTQAEQGDTIVSWVSASAYYKGGVDLRRTVYCTRTQYGYGAPSWASCQHENLLTHPYVGSFAAYAIERVKG